MRAKRSPTGDKGSAVAHCVGGSDEDRTNAIEGKMHELRYDIEAERISRTHGAGTSANSTSMAEREISQNFAE